MGMERRRETELFLGGFMPTAVDVLDEGVNTQERNYPIFAGQPNLQDQTVVDSSLRIGNRGVQDEIALQQLFTGYDPTASIGAHLIDPNKHRVKVPVWTCVPDLDDDTYVKSNYYGMGSFLPVGNQRADMEDPSSLEFSGMGDRPRILNGAFPYGLKAAAVDDLDGTWSASFGNTPVQPEDADHYALDLLAVKHQQADPLRIATHLIPRGFAKVSSTGAVDITTAELRLPKIWAGAFDFFYGIFVSTAPGIYSQGTLTTLTPETLWSVA